MCLQENEGPFPRGYLEECFSRSQSVEIVNTFLSTCDDFYLLSGRRLISAPAFAAFKVPGCLATVKSLESTVTVTGRVPG